MLLMGVQMLTPEFIVSVEECGRILLNLNYNTYLKFYLGVLIVYLPNITLGYSELPTQIFTSVYEVTLPNYLSKFLQDFSSLCY